MKLPREIRNNKYLLDGIIIKIRFQNVEPLQHNNIACMTYKNIANIVGWSVTYCRDICSEFIKEKTSIQNKPIMKSRSKKLKDIKH